MAGLGKLTIYRIGMKKLRTCIHYHDTKWCTISSRSHTSLGSDFRKRVFFLRWYENKLKFFYLFRFICVVDCKNLLRSFLTRVRIEKPITLVIKMSWWKPFLFSFCWRIYKLESSAIIFAFWMTATNQWLNSCTYTEIAFQCKNLLLSKENSFNFSKNLFLWTKNNE